MKERIYYGEVHYYCRDCYTIIEDSSDGTKCVVCGDLLCVDCVRKNEIGECVCFHCVESE